jgi:hypothetical protein
MGEVDLRYGRGKQQQKQAGRQSTTGGDAGVGTH